MEQKIRNDGMTDEQTVSYLLNRLKGSAASVAVSFLEQNPFATAPDFWKLLEDQYSDTMLAERAVTSVLTWSQGKNSFRAARNRFIRLANDAGMIEQHNTLRSCFLRGLNDDLRRAMWTVSLKEGATITEVMERVAAIDENMYRDRVNMSLRRSAVVTRPDEMDWTPTSARSAQAGERGGRKTAKWVPRDVIMERRRKQLCLRCGEPDHFASRCSLLPPSKPSTGRVNTAFSPPTKEPEEDHEHSESEQEAEN